MLKYFGRKKEASYFPLLSTLFLYSFTIQKASKSILVTAFNKMILAEDPPTLGTQKILFQPLFVSVGLYFTEVLKLFLSQNAPHSR